MGVWFRNWRDIHEGDARVQRRIHHTDAVGTDDADSALARDRGEALLLGDPFLLAGLGIPGREYDSPAYTRLDTIKDDLLDGLARGGDHRAVDGFRNVSDIRIA